jgi:hypothetical protein
MLIAARSIGLDLDASPLAALVDAANAITKATPPLQDSIIRRSALIGRSSRRHADVMADAAS